MPRLPDIVRRAKPVEKPQMVPVMVPPTSAAAVINNLIAEDILNPATPLEPVSHTHDVLAALVAGMSKDGDIASVKDELTRIAANQTEKADVITTVLNQIDHERLADMLFMRAKMEKHLKRAASRGEINTSQAMAIYGLADETIKAIQAKQAKTKPVDSGTTVAKVDSSQQIAERHAADRWEGTTPQGREIIRKKLFTLKRMVMAEAHKLIIDVPSDPPPDTPPPAPAV